MKRGTFYLGLPRYFSKRKKAAIKLAMGRLYGGVTWQAAEGGWMNPETGRWIDEPAVVVTVLTDRTATDLETTAEYLRGILGQSEVYLTVDFTSLHVARAKVVKHGL